MGNGSRIRDRLKEMRALVKAGKERLATHSPVWAVYLAGETFRAMGQLLDEMEEEVEALPEGAREARLRKTG